MGSSVIRNRLHSGGRASGQAEGPAEGGGFHALGWVPVALIVWALIFGVYEVVERSFLQQASPNLLHALHIIRGTGTSFLLAGLAAWYLLRRGALTRKVLPHEGVLRTIVAESEERELISHEFWIIRLRWLAIAGVITVTLVCRFVFASITGPSTLALLLIATVMVGYNALFASWPIEQIKGVRLAFVQVFLDLASLTLMIYFAGGAHNPFVFFYIFHILIAGILLRKKETFLVTGIACALFGGMTLLQFSGFLDTYPLIVPGLGGEAGAQLDWLYLAGILTAFVTTAGCTAYFTTTIMDKLRSRGAVILEASEILTQEREKTENIVHSVGAGLLILDPEDRIAWSNEIARDWFGERLEEDRCFGQLWQEEIPCEACSVHAVHTEEKTVTSEQTIILEGKQRFFLTSCSPIRDARGDVQQILVLLQDITPMKEMQIQLAQAGKMVAVGQLAAGIAHEINNPLATVASSAEILSEAILGEGDIHEESQATARRHIRKIEENVFRCKDIIQNLLGFSRHEDRGAENVDIEYLVAEAMGLVQGSANARSRSIVLQTRRGEVQGPGLAAMLERSSALLDGEGEGLSIHSRPRPIQQVVLNLLLNALDATKPGDEVRVACLPRDGGVELLVTDTGQGIEPEHVERVFDPFFTTKPPGQGTGLGLYISHQIVDSIQGRISVESTSGRGTAFRVWLPQELAPPGAERATV